MIYLMISFSTGVVVGIVVCGVVDFFRANRKVTLRDGRGTLRDLAKKHNINLDDVRENEADFEVLTGKRVSEEE